MPMALAVARLCGPQLPQPLSIAAGKYCLILSVVASQISASTVFRVTPTLNGYADDILEICDALELSGDIIFVGHSVSCSIGYSCR